MMKCFECGKTFKEPREIYDKVDFWGSSCSLPGYPVCPFCESEDIGEVDND